LSLLPLNRANEREESESKQNKLSQGQVSLLIDRGRKGDENEPDNKANRDPRRENLIPVPESLSQLIQYCTPPRFKLMVQGYSKKGGDAL